MNLKTEPAGEYDLAKLMMVAIVMMLRRFLWRFLGIGYFGYISATIEMEYFVVAK